MDVKSWKVVIGSEGCPWTSSINMCLLYETSIDLSNEHLMDCTHENCPVKHIPRPDPAEVERAIDKLLQAHFIMGARIRWPMPTKEREDYDKARADLLKLVGGNK